MGRGDKRTKRGKITIGSFGVSRPSRTEKPVATAATEAPAEAAKKAPAKKVAKPKKTEE